MALTNAEKQQRWREKQKAIKAGLIEPEVKPDPVDTQFLLHGFGDWLRESEERAQSFQKTMQELADLPPDEINGEKSGQDLLAVNFTISVCIDAVRNLAELVSEFKRAKLMKHFEEMPLNSAAEKAAAMHQAAQFGQMFEDYGRKSRVELQTYALAIEADAMRALAAALDDIKESE